MSLQPPSPTTPPDCVRPLPAKPRWLPSDVVSLVIVVCYGAAALVVAAGLFVRLASHS